MSSAFFENEMRDLTKESTFSFQDVVEVLGQEWDDVSDEELETVPMERIVAELEKLGVGPDHAFSPAPEGAGEVLARAMQVHIPLVPRYGLVWSIRAVMAKTKLLVITGPSGCGKTVLMRQLLPPTLGIWRPYTQSYSLDCTALRMSEPVLFERHAVWALFGIYDDRRKRFLSELGKDEQASPLVAFLRRYAKDGLLLLDHVEHLDSGSALNAWLKSQLLPLAEELSLTIVFCERNPAVARRLGALRSLPYVFVEPLNAGEIEEWVNLPFFREWPHSITSTSRILRLTGGSPRLVRDLANYVAIRFLEESSNRIRHRQTPPSRGTEQRAAIADSRWITGSAECSAPRFPHFAETKDPDRSFSIWSRAATSDSTRNVEEPATTSGLVHRFDQIQQNVFSKSSPNQPVENPNGKSYVCANTLNWTALRDFARWRPQRYMIDCDRFIWAARGYPKIMTEGLQVFDGINAGDSRSIDISFVKNALLATGVVIQKANGQLSFASPIHGRRIRYLIQSNIFALMLQRGNMQRLDSLGIFPLLRGCTELATDPLWECLVAERIPSIALQRLREIMRRWDFEAEIALLDPNNRRIWITNFAGKEMRLGPINSSNQPDFVLAVQSGQPRTSELGELFIPLVGARGIVEVMARGQFKKNKYKYNISFRNEYIIGLLRGLRPAILQIAAQFWLHREQKLNSRLLYRPDEPGAGWRAILSVLLAATGQAAIAVLERSQHGVWFVCRFEPVGKDPLFFSNTRRAEPEDHIRLDEISNHRSRHGLVLKGHAVGAIFPMLGRDDDTAVYLRPVRLFGGQSRIVMFMFKGAAADRLDGNLQHRLSAVAPELVVVAS